MSERAQCAKAGGHRRSTQQLDNPVKLFLAGRVKRHATSGQPASVFRIGKPGAAACWQNDDSVPPPGQCHRLYPVTYTAAMKFIREARSAVTIRRLDKGAVTIGDEVFTDNVTLFRDSASPGPDFESVSSLREEQLADVIAEKTGDYRCRQRLEGATGSARVKFCDGAAWYRLRSDGHTGSLSHIQHSLKRRARRSSGIENHKG